VTASLLYICVYSEERSQIAAESQLRIGDTNVSVIGLAYWNDGATRKFDQPGLRSHFNRPWIDRAISEQVEVKAVPTS